jgi:hypothetical protein
VGGLVPGKLPKMDELKPSLGVISLMSSEDLQIRVKAGSGEGVEDDPAKL